MTAAEVESLATLPPLDVLRGQVLGAIIAPLTALAGLVNAPLQNLYGLIDARIEQLEAQGDTSASRPSTARRRQPPRARRREPARGGLAEETPSRSSG